MTKIKRTGAEAPDNGTDEVVEGAVQTAVVEPVGEDSPLLDPSLDLVQDDALAESDDAVEGGGADKAGGSTSAPRGRRSAMVAGAVAAITVAAAAVWAASTFGGNGQVTVPENVTDSSVVVEALDAGGVACTSAAVSGQVATCNPTVAFRMFDTTADAETYVADMLESPLTSSAIGWVRHGNLVVAAPLTSTPDIAAALGEGSQIY